MILNKFLLIIFSIFIFIGCGGGINSSEIDNSVKEADGLVFVGNDLLGVWTQSSYDVNDEPVQNQLGIEISYRFESGNKISQNISLIEQWIPLGDYAVNDTILSYNQSTSTVEFEFIEKKSDGCLKLGKTTITNNNPVFDAYYHFCKIS